jgi:hypothetical protein
MLACMQPLAGMLSKGLNDRFLPRVTRPEGASRALDLPGDGYRVDRRFGLRNLRRVAWRCRRSRAHAQGYPTLANSWYSAGGEAIPWRRQLGSLPAAGQGLARRGALRLECDPSRLGPRRRDPAVCRRRLRQVITPLWTPTTTSQNHAKLLIHPDRAHCRG